MKSPKKYKKSADFTRNQRIFGPGVARYQLRYTRMLCTEGQLNYYTEFSALCQGRKCLLGDFLPKAGPDGAAYRAVQIR